MTSSPQPIGVVLAGGLSSRMGRDKALLPWAGVTLLDHMIGLLKSAGLERVVVAGARPGYDAVPDLEPGQGPGIAISHLLAGFGPDDWVLVVPVDMPLLTPGLIGGLIGEAGQPLRAAHYLRHPLPALLPARNPNGALLHGHSLRELHAQAGSLALPLDASDQAAFHNVNTPEEWNEAQGARP